MSYRLDVLPDDGWAGRVADDVVAWLAGHPAGRICLPTGDTPRPLYQALVERATRGEATFAAAEVVALDEYLGLPPGDPALAGVSLRRELIDHLDPPPAAFHGIDSQTADPDGEAARHDAAAAAGLDLTLLGLGVNGHVGLNEPGSAVDSPTRVVTLADASRAVATDRYGAASAPARGITLGIGRLLESREIWLLVTGTRKAAPLARALHGPEGSDCPASFLRRHPALRIVADESAAGLLSAEAR